MFRNSRLKTSKAKGQGFTLATVLVSANEAQRNDRNPAKTTGKTHIDHTKIRQKWLLGLLLEPMLLVAYSLDAGDMMLRTHGSADFRLD